MVSLGHNELIGPLGTNFCENLIEIHTFSLKNLHLKRSSAKWRPFCVFLNVLSNYIYIKLFDVITHPCSNFTLWNWPAVEVRTRMSCNISLKIGWGNHLSMSSTSDALCKQKWSCWKHVLFGNIYIYLILNIFIWHIHQGIQGSFCVCQPMRDDVTL